MTYLLDEEFLPRWGKHPCHHHRWTTDRRGNHNRPSRVGVCFLDAAMASAPSGPPHGGDWSKTLVPNPDPNPDPEGDFLPLVTTFDSVSPWMECGKTISRISRMRGVRSFFLIAGCVQPFGRMRISKIFWFLLNCHLCKPKNHCVLWYSLALNLALNLTFLSLILVDLDFRIFLKLFFMFNLTMVDL